MLISDKVAQGRILNNAKICLGEDENWGLKTLNINITGRCNERCVYCTYSQCGDHKKGIDIEEKLFYRVTKEAYELGITDVGLYTTGEPFLNNHLAEYISWCKSLGFPYVYLSTNGILCTPENLQKVISAGLDSLKFSVSSVEPENFNRHHGVDACEKVLNNLMYAYNYREENQLNYKLYIFVIITKYNMHEKEKIRRKLGPYTDEILFSDCINSTIPMVGMEEFLVPEEQGTKTNGIIPCPQLFNRVVVDEYGWMCACCNGSGKKYGRVADLHEKSLKDAINARQMTELRKRHLKRDLDGLLCKICSTRHFCESDMHAFHHDFETEAIQTRPINICDDIKRRFESK